MSAVCVYSMCVRVSRGLLRLRNEASASTAAGLVRSFSVAPGNGSEIGPTEGLAQAILQQRLQQQGSQVGLAVPINPVHLALTFIHTVHTSENLSEANWHTAEPGSVSND